MGPCASACETALAIARGRIAHGPALDSSLPKAASYGSVALRRFTPAMRPGAAAMLKRSAVELREAAAHFDRAAAQCPAPAMKARYADKAAWCRSKVM